MSGALIGSIILGVISLIVVIVGALASEENWLCGGVVLGVITGLFGFGLVCSTIGATESYTEQKVFEKAKTSAAVMIDVEGQTEVFDDAKTYNEFDSIDRVYIKHVYNSYGKELTGYSEIVLQKPD